MKKVILGLFLLFPAIFLSAQWQSVKTPYGGRVISLFSANGYLLAGTFNGGGYYSADAGQHWNNIKDGLAATGVNRFNASGQYYFAATSQSVFRSTSPAGTWTSINPVVFGGCDWGDMFVLDSIIIISDCNYFYRSEDYGDTWVEISAGLPPGMGYPYFYRYGDVIYVGIGGWGVFKSVDYGVEWELVGGNLPNNNIYSFFIKDEYMFVGVQGGGVYRSEIDADDWTLMNNGMSTTSIIDVKNIENKIYALTFNGFFESDDNAESWNPVSTLPQLVNTLVSTGDTLFAGTQNGGVYFSTDDATTWTPCNEGLNNSLIVGFAARENEIYAAANTAGVFKSTDGGATWATSNEGYTHTSVTEIGSQGSNIFIVGDYGKLHVRKANSNLWEVVGNGITDNFYRSLASNGDRAFAGTFIQGLMRSTDNGGNWVASNFGMGTQTVYALAAIGNNLLAATQQGAFKSKNNGSSWSHPNNDLKNKNINVVAAKDSLFFAGTVFSGVWRSVDIGETWQQVNNGLPVGTVGTMTAGEGLIAVVANGSVFVSGDNGDSWTSIDEGLPVSNVSSLFIKDQYLYAGTGGNGIWRRPLNEIITSSVQPDVAGNKVDVYPEPARSVLTISTPEQEIGKVFTIISVHGTPMLTGQITHTQTTISVAELPSGTYLLRIPDSGLVRKFIKN